MTIIEAIDDPHLLGPLFSGATWTRWRVFLAALFGLPISGEALAIYRHHTERTEPPSAPSREAALICGRRGGKSRILAQVAVFLAAFRDYSAHLAPGEQPAIAIIAADRKQAKVILRYCIGLLRAVRMLADLIEDEFAESVTLTNGLVIEIHTGSIGSPRGRTFVAVLADEIAFWRSDDSANPDAEVISAVRPGLASIPNSMLLMASSPYAKRGVLWNTFRRYWGRDGGRVLVWRGTSLEMNPALDPAIVEDAREEDPQAAASEYDAQFRDDIAAFVSREVIEACTIAGRHELPPLPGISYAAFVDPSGGSSDSMTLAIGHRTGSGRPLWTPPAADPARSVFGRVPVRMPSAAEGDAEPDRSIAVLDAVREVPPPFSPEAVVREFAALLKTYRIQRVHGDRYAGEWPRERFAVHGIAYEPAEKPKSDMYRDVLPLLNAGRAELLDLPRLANQFCGLERRTSRGGRDSIDHAPGAHDDVSNAVAGALLLSSVPPPMGARRISLNFMER